MSTAKSKPKLCITQAKKIGVDGTTTYYYSLPKIKFFDIKGRLWIWNRLNQFKKEREPNSKIFYN